MDLWIYGFWPIFGFNYGFEDSERPPCPQGSIVLLFSSMMQREFPLFATDLYVFCHVWVKARSHTSVLIAKAMSLKWVYSISVRLHTLQSCNCNHKNDFGPIL